MCRLINHYIYAVFVLTLPLACSSAFAVNNDREVKINADYMKFDLESGSSIYEGNVSISQGSIKLSGNKVVISRNKNVITEINVDGNPAEYLQDANTDNKVHATSQHMKYTASTNRLVLTDKASLIQQGSTVQSQRIVYDTRNKVVIAGKGSNNNGDGERVNITLTPAKPNTDKQDAGE